VINETANRGRTNARHLRRAGRPNYIYRIDLDRLDKFRRRSSLDLTVQGARDASPVKSIPRIAAPARSMIRLNDFIHRRAKPAAFAPIAARGGATTLAFSFCHCYGNRCRIDAQSPYMGIGAVFH